MEKGVGSDLFVNDGSFFEKFKKIQQEKEISEQTKSNVSTGAAVMPPKPSVLVNKRSLDPKVSDGKKMTVSASGSKLAFSLKQKSRVAITPVKFAVDEEEEGGETEVANDVEACKRQKLGQVDATQSPPFQKDVAPFPPSDPTVRKVVDKLATFVAKNGRQFEHITRQRNPGDTPFKFLFDSNCPEYKYYMSRLIEEEKALAESKESQSVNSASMSSSTSRSSNVSQRSTPQQHSSYQAPASSSSKAFSVSNRSNVQQQSNYQMPASALYGTYEESLDAGASSSAADSIARMEFYMKKAAQEERKKPPKLSKDEMPPPSSQGSGKKGHHMGDYIPQEELEKFLAACNDAGAQKSAREAAEKAKIQADNIGHKLLSKMGWKEGEGLGSDKSGRADPVMAGSVKLNNLGVGAHQPGEVTADDDIYEQYKKRMMLGYRHRPNPLNNPRKAYY